MNTVSTRYSETDLVEFKVIVERLLEKGLTKLDRLEGDYKKAAEDMEEENDWMDDSSSQNDLSLLQTLVYRQRKHVTDLQNAMQRIHNKSYGICMVTGQLIEKRRLMAVPTTTKSMAAKNLGNKPVKKVVVKSEEAVEQPKEKPTKKKEPVIISRIIKKSNSITNSIEDAGIDDDLVDDLLGIDNDLDEDVGDGFDFDSIAAED